VRRYYGIDDGRPWTQPELGRMQGLQRARIGRLVDGAVRHLLGPDALPLVERTCVVCTTPFTLTSRALRRKVCGRRTCDCEQRRRSGKASAARRVQRRVQGQQEAAARR
jgi:hypothetical protein